jgi:hypothetical protein
MPSQIRRCCLAPLGIVAEGTDPPVARVAEKLAEASILPTLVIVVDD